MKANELRSGSIISINGNIVVVDHIRCHDYSVTIKDGFDIAFNGGNLLTDNDDDVKPIQLTKSVLEAAGFKKSPANNSYYVSFPEMKSEIHFEEFRGGLVQSVGSFIPTETSHLHQLQNLVYCITGTELQIDLNKLK